MLMQNYPTWNRDITWSWNQSFVKSYVHFKENEQIPSCHCAFFGWYFVGPKYFLVGISRVRIFFLVASNFFYGYFVGLNFFFVGFSWVQNFCRGYFVNGKFYFVVISWFHDIFWWVFRGPKIFVGNFLIFNCWSHEKSGIKIWLKLRIQFQTDFNNCEFYLY